MEKNINNPKISVIIPVYNGEKTLRKCLKSILNQTYNNYEVIIIDNNSTDKSKDIIKGFQSKSKKITYVFEAHRGRGSARNAGIIKAKGEIIVMTDSDCIVPNNWIQELTNPIVDKHESAIMGSEKDLINNYWTKNIQKANLDFVKLGLRNNYVSSIDTKNFAIEAPIMKRCMFDSTITALEDFEFYLRLKKFVRIRFLSSVKVGHNHPSSFSALVRMNFERGYWAKKIYDKHKKRTGVKNETMFTSISLKNFLLFLPSMVLQFINEPIQKAYFTLVADTSWRAGILWSIITQK